MMSMANNRWDAVVFDYGRVLSHSPSAAEIEELAALVGVSEPPFFQLYSDTRDEYDCGRHTCDQHWQRFSCEAGIVLGREQVARIVEHETRLWLRINQPALELARALKAQGMRTAILSNMPPDLLRAMREHFDWLGEFEVQIWSCEHGVINPIRPSISCASRRSVARPSVCCFLTIVRGMSKAHAGPAWTHRYSSRQSKRGRLCAQGCGWE